MSKKADSTGFFAFLSDIWAWMRALAHNYVTRGAGFFFAAIFALVLNACSEKSEPVREWKASDHAQPTAQPEQEPAQAAAMPSDHGVSAGAEVWSMHCATCHGQSGNGQGTMMRVPFDFTKADWQKKYSDEALATTIRTGRNTMPPFAEVLSEMEIRAVIQWLRAQAPSAR